MLKLPDLLFAKTILCLGSLFLRYLSRLIYRQTKLKGRQRRYPTTRPENSFYSTYLIIGTHLNRDQILHRRS